MSGLSQYQNVFRIAKHDGMASVAPSRGKRMRLPLSCTACRTRKLKCDRQLPCLACSKRGDAALCSYSYQSRNDRESRDERSRMSDEQLRLQRLEQMVSGLMQTIKNSSENPARNSSPHSPTVDQGLKDLSVQNSPRISEPPSGGYLYTSGTETKYLGATHWTAIMENVRDIQVFLDPDTDGGPGFVPQSTLNNGPDVVLDTTEPLTLAEVLNSLPPQPIVNQLLKFYFHPEHVSNPIIHNAKFLRECESFFAYPSSVSFLWISILFSILWLGSQIGHSIGYEYQSPMESKFLMRAGQALVTGRYHKARPYSVEAVLLYAFCKYSQGEDPGDTWVMIGICTRLALTMGYHRDPRHLAKISPFEGEMRRRTFASVEAWDLLLSFQGGLPPIIHEEEYDTEPPSNLFDEDFDEDCKVLPPSRLPSVLTPMLCFCYKSRFAKMFKRVIRHALSLKIPSYEDTMKLDGELREAARDMPPSLQMRPLISPTTDEDLQVSKGQFIIDMIYQKSLCVLHRIYLSHDRSNPKYAYSRKVCTDAALQMLKHQAEQYFASQSGGKVSKGAISSVTTQDFLLAAMIICLDLYESHRNSATTSPEYLEALIKKHDALRLSYEIWMSRSTLSRDTRRGANILVAMLSKVPRPHVAANAAQQSATLPGKEINGAASSGSATNSSGVLSINTPLSSFPSQEVPVDSSAVLGVNAADPLNIVFNEIDNIDWGLVDQYLFNRDGFCDVSLDAQSPDFWGLLQPAI